MKKPMNDILSRLQEQADENTERWKEIEMYYKTLKQIVDSGKYSPDNMSVGLINLKLLFLLVDHLRPMSTANEQVEAMQTEIQDLLNAISGEINND